MVRYIIGFIAAVLGFFGGVAGFTFVFNNSVSTLASQIANGDLTTTAIVAVSIPFGALLPFLFSLIKAMDICLERINQHLRSTRMVKLLDEIRTSKANAQSYLIKDNDWQYIYKMQRDRLIDVDHTVPGWAASYI